jgi:DNA-binding MarR family transcriptional regulator/ribosomal protein S18 acetylase RimI-like enzyme
MPKAAQAERPAAPLAHVHAVRRFNRFYTRLIGALDEGFIDSAFSLTEVRILYEVAHREGTTASAVAVELALDAGYLSRMLRRFRTLGLVRTQTSAADGRQALLTLTAKGRRTVTTLEARSNREVARLLGRVTVPDERRILQAMATIERLMGEGKEPRVPFVIRPPEPGDLGWIVHRQGALYAHEEGYTVEFEALVATIVGEFGRSHDPSRERCWIAEREGEVVGSIFAVRESDDIAKLRLLYVEPSARGLGIGARLVDECVRFVRARGYKVLTLWTQGDLLPARRLYEKAGFRLVESAPHHSFGRDLVAETWTLTL